MSHYCLVGEAEISSLSFLMSIPLILLSSIYEIIFGLLNSFSEINILYLLIAFLIFVSSFAGIRIMLFLSKFTQLRFLGFIT